MIENLRRGDRGDGAAGGGVERQLSSTGPGVFPARLPVVLWNPDLPGVVTLPSGRTVRGHGRRRPRPDGAAPDFALHLDAHAPPPAPWPTRWVAWPDFRLPRDRADARAAFTDALARSASERVEISCSGGRGRTGTALACLAILDGVPPHEAVPWARAHFDPKAVETSDNGGADATWSTSMRRHPPPEQPLLLAPTAARSHLRRCLCAMRRTCVGAWDLRRVRGGDRHECAMSAVPAASTAHSDRSPPTVRTATASSTGPGALGGAHTGKELMFELAEWRCAA